MSHGSPHWEEQADGVERTFPPGFVAEESSQGQVWKRRLQLFALVLSTWIAQNLGWGVSLGVHATLAAFLGLFVVPLSLGVSHVGLETRIGTEEARIDLSTTALVDQSSSGGVPLDLTPVVQKLGESNPLDAQQMNWTPEIQSTALSNSVSDSLGGRGKGAGQGDGTGVGGGKVEFFGTRGNGNSVVFVVDLSGSMIDNHRFERAREELLRALEKLASSQRFYVVFYNSDEIPLFAPTPLSRLMVATRAAKNKSRRWIQALHPQGGTEPRSALDRALRMKPDMIYLLTDGEIPSETRGFLKERNQNKTVIHTIAFQSLDGQTVLKEIAEDHRGTYRFVP